MLNKKPFDIDAKYACPKCNGLSYTKEIGAGGNNANKCILCGLHYDLGGVKESLKKQILVDSYINPLS